LETLEDRTLLATIGYLYTNNNPSGPVTVSAFAVQNNGDLTPVAGSPFSTGGLSDGFTYNPQSIGVDQTAHRVYVTNQASNRVSPFTINPPPGGLTAVPGGPFATHSRPVGVAVDPLDRFVYVANHDSGDLEVFAIQANGALNLVGSTPTAVGEW